MATTRQYMHMRTWTRAGALVAATILVGACADPSDEERAGLGDEKDVELSTTSYPLLSENGLRTLNGLTSVYEDNGTGPIRSMLVMAWLVMSLFGQACSLDTHGTRLPAAHPLTDTVAPAVDDAGLASPQTSAGGEPVKIHGSRLFTGP